LCVKTRKISFILRTKATIVGLVAKGIPVESSVKLKVIKGRIQLGQVESSVRLKVVGDFKKVSVWFKKNYCNTIGITVGTYNSFYGCLSNCNSNYNCSQLVVLCYHCFIN